MIGEFAIGQALRIYATRARVDAHNSLVLEEYKEKGEKVYTIKAQDRIINGDPKLTAEQIKAKISNDINKTGGLPATLSIFVGAKVMLRSNVDVARKLVNGSIGNVTEIIWQNFRRDQMYDTDIPKVKVNFEGGVGEHIIQAITSEFEAKGNSTAERYMLPLVLCWASTTHKMQGSTLDSLVGGLSDMWNCKGLAYVMLSRVRTLEGLRLESINAAEIVGSKPCNMDAKLEMERMRRGSNTKK